MNLVVVGTQWGDEGKGKMVDYLAHNADIVVRFSGGANAGHTIRIANKTFALHLVPAGIMYPGIIVVLGSGMVIDIAALFAELADLSANGISWEGRVLVSDRAHIVLPGYRHEDATVDQGRPFPIGTTGRGIGVAYARKAARDGIRVADLWDARIWNSLTAHDKKPLAPYREQLAAMKINLAAFMMENQQQKILLEGAQGTLLDIDHGTYPYVSSGISNSSGAAGGAAIGPRRIDKCVGVFKAYQTRVGNGPFPSEMSVQSGHGDLAHTLRELGQEYGATTGRPRRIGFLDLVALRYSSWVNSLDGLILSHLNLYDGFERIGVCTAYELDGKRMQHFPAAVCELEGVRPVVEWLPGWAGAVATARCYADLPAAARAFVQMIAEYTGVAIVGYSVGPSRHEAFMTEDPWTRS